MLVWSGTDIKTKINRHRAQGSIRTNLHTAVYDGHRLSSDSTSWGVAQIAAHQLGELIQWFQGFVILFSGCADVYDLDFPGANSQIDAIPGARGTYNLYAGELLKIIQDYGGVCLPGMKREGFL